MPHESIGQLLYNHIASKAKEQNCLPDGEEPPNWMIVDYLTDSMKDGEFAKFVAESLQPTLKVERERTEIRHPCGCYIRITDGCFPSGNVCQRHWQQVMSVKTKMKEKRS
jgi:hypothetical protein